jgi:sRNA-binding carbon storage regulator CsrA
LEEGELMAVFNEVTIQIDENRSVTISSTDKSTTVIAVEDPHTVAIVEIDKEELLEITQELIKRL